MAITTESSETDGGTTLLASFHLLRYPAGAETRKAITRMGSERQELMKTPGLRFFRQLGTGSGTEMTLSADLRRWGLLAFWRHEDDLEAFLSDAPIPQRWADAGAERYDVRLATARALGTWGRATFNVKGAAKLAPDAPVAILTRAAIRPARLARFWQAVPRPALDLSAHPALLASVGIGEVPVLRQATFSIWSSLAGAQDFAYRRAAHREVIDRTRDENWYSSELFARFQPLTSSGTWSGRDPLAGLLPVA